MGGAERYSTPRRAHDGVLHLRHDFVSGDGSDDVSGACPGPAAANNARAKVTPNYAAWAHLQSFTLYQASMLWCDREPTGSLPNHESETWLEVLKHAVRSGEVRLETQTLSDRKTLQTARASLGPR